MKRKVLVIVGPTASGKSGLAVKLAKRFKSEVISADSRQVYKGLNMGTGKITKPEMKGVPHHLLDVADPKRQFTAAQYKTLADEIVRYIALKDRLPIVVGGTGFYIDVLTGTSLPEVEPNPRLRKRLASKTPEQLFNILEKKDPERSKSIDKHNKVRLIRALEIIEALGKVPRPSKIRSPYKFIYIGLKPDDLDKRIKTRLIKRLPGIMREVKRLHKEGLSWKRMLELGLEYRYVSLCLQRKLSKQEMTEKLFTEIRRYAKRQMTWFRRNKKIKWFKPSEYREMEKYVGGR